MTWTHPAFEAAADLLARRTGLIFGPTRRDGAETGMRRAMGRAGVRDPLEYPALLEADAAVLDDLVVELTVGETYFFREPDQFRFLRREVLPDLWRRHGPGAMVRCWSAACASGEEAYSLAILLEEEGAGPRSHVVATDISRAALAKARRAVYGNWSLRGEGAASAAPYLLAADGRFTLNERIRRRVHFEYLNLALDVYPALATDTWGMNIVLCRNVLIYFNAETIRHVARRLYETLVPGGWLLTAASDPPLAAYARFETVTTDAGVLYRRDAAAAVYFPAPPAVAPPAPLSTVSPSAFAATLPAGEAWGGGRRLDPPPPRQVSPAGGEGEVRPPPVVGAEASDPLPDARAALAAGDYGRAADLTRGRIDDAEAAVVHVRALANLDAVRAEMVCAEAAAHSPLSSELHYLHGVLLVSLGRDDDAARALRRVLYLDRSLAVAHFTLGSVLGRAGDAAGARRAYRNARALCLARPADEAAALSDGEPAARLAAAAAAQLAILEVPEVSAP